MKIFDANIKGIAAAILADGTIDFDAINAELRDAIFAAIESVATETVNISIGQLGITTPAIDGSTRASDWARQYAGDVNVMIGKTTQERVNGVIAKYNETPGMTLQDIVDALEPTFGAERAESIAITEVTRAAAEGFRVHQDELKQAGIKTRRISHTNTDDLVCEICRPLDGKSENDWGYFFEGPPYHSRCRCFITLEVI